MRTSPTHYIAPSAISITPNANGSANDLAVNVARGTKIKVYCPNAGIGMDEDGNFREWVLAGRNRRLSDPEGKNRYTVFARLKKDDTDSGYIVFAPKYKKGEDFSEKYKYLTNMTPSGFSTINYDPSAETLEMMDKYLFVRMGEVSLPESGRRELTLDTGILGTDEYNAQWRINPDDLPDKDPRYAIEDRGQWVATPRVEYTGVTGQRAPDGTLATAVASKLGWTGDEPISFTKGQAIDEPYHYRFLTRLRWITQRFLQVNDSYSDADLYKKLTGVTKGWDQENILEISRAWNHGALWECLVDGTMQEPMLGRTDWKLISGGTFSLGFYTSGDDPTPISGLNVRPGFIDETVVPHLLFGQEDISDMVTAWKWVRESGNAALDEAWGNSMHTERDDDQSPLKSDTRAIHITDDDLPGDWSIDGGKVSFKCTARFLDGGEEAEIINSITII